MTPRAASAGLLSMPSASASERVSTLRWIGRFARVSPAAGAHLLARVAGFRHFDLLEAALPPGGPILDLGCGHGLLAILAAARAPERRVLGIDILEARVAVGRAVVARYGGPGNVALRRGDGRDLPDGPFAAICFAHTLMYLPLREQASLLERCRERLRSGGLLLIAEQVGEPAWKARLVRFQESLVVGARARLRGRGEWGRFAREGVHLWSEPALLDHLRGLGLHPASERLDRWSHLSHRLITASATRRPR
jgi:SAM-dependent methyltransferase